MSQLISLTKNKNTNLTVILKHSEFDQLFEEKNVELIAFLTEYFDGIIQFAFKIKPSDDKIQEICERVITTKDYKTKKFFKKNTNLTKFVLKFPEHFDEHPEESRITFFRILPEIIFTNHESLCKCYSSETFIKSIFEHINEDYVYDFVIKFIDTRYMTVTECLDRVDAISLIMKDTKENDELSIRKRSVIAHLLGAKCAPDSAFEVLLDDSFYAGLIANIMELSDCEASYQMLWRISVFLYDMKAAKQMGDELVNCEARIEKLASGKNKEVAKYAMALLIQIANIKNEAGNNAVKAVCFLNDLYKKDTENTESFDLFFISLQSLKKTGLLTQELVDKTKVKKYVVSEAKSKKNAENGREFWQRLHKISSLLLDLNEGNADDDAVKEIIEERIGIKSKIVERSINIKENETKPSKKMSPTTKKIILIIVSIIAVIGIAAAVYFFFFYEKEEYFFTDSDFDSDPRQTHVPLETEQAEPVEPAEPIEQIEQEPQEPEVYEETPLTEEDLDPPVQEENIQTQQEEVEVAQEEIETDNNDIGL